MLEVITGRDLSLNRSEGIVGLGDPINPYLPDGRSANIVLTAGAARSGLDYAGFTAKYLAPRRELRSLPGLHCLPLR